jgi:pimeloyl-ACP methyl ester carboxylesterase
VDVSGWELPEHYQAPGGLVRWGRLGQGPPVVLLHGTPFSSWVWRDVAAALARHHQVFVWDMPGYGRSEMAGGQDVSLAAQAETFAALLDHWRLAAPRVVAHDIGGAVALRAYLLHGARYDRLALADTVVMSPWGSPFFRLVAEHAAVFEQLPPHLHAALVREYVHTASHRELPASTLERLAQPWLTPVGQAAFYRQIAQADRRHTDEIEGMLPDLDLPMLVCWGAEDSWLPAEAGRRLAAHLPGSRLHVIPGAGHLVQEDAPAQLTALLTEFLGDEAS